MILKGISNAEIERLRWGLMGLQIETMNECKIIT